MSPFWEFFEEHREALGKRGPTFAAMFEYLDQQPDPICIIETGCVRTEDNWDGDGQSTILFDRYIAQRLNGRVYSVDLDAKAVELVRTLTMCAQIYVMDSVEFLKNFVKRPPAHKVDLVYLDSFDYSPENAVESANHHMNEFLAIRPMLTPASMVVVDDTVSGNDDLKGWCVFGKGTIVADYAMTHAAHMRFAQYQIGWTDMVRDEAPSVVELITRARAHVEAGDPLAADQLYQRVISGVPEPTSAVERVALGEAGAWLARQAIARRRHGIGAEYYRAALATDPRATEYRLELIKRALVPMGQFREALAEARKAVAIEPTSIDALSMLGMVHHEMGNIDDAITVKGKVLELAPDNPLAWIDMAAILLDTERYDQARVYANKCMGTEREADGFNILAMVAFREHRWEDSLELYDKAIAGSAFDPAKIHWNKSLTLHAMGRYKEGWIEHEHRNFCRSHPAMYIPPNRFRRPLWHGEPAPARIHVHTEAGAGDNICLIRYLALLVARGYDVRYECEPDLLDLARRSFPAVQVIEKAADYPGSLGLSDFDYHLPIGTIPFAFDTDIDTVPSLGAYLKTDPDLVEHYRRQVEPGSIGLCWSSGIREGVWMQKYGHNKSMALRKMSQLLMDFPCVSLQIGPERDEMYDFRGLVNNPLPDGKPSWDHTAALIANLRAVVTVDTGVAHLAGALGVPVHLAMHTQGSWHFMVEREGSPWNYASPWYPTMSVYRQKKMREWGPVIERITKALR